MQRLVDGYAIEFYISVNVYGNCENKFARNLVQLCMFVFRYMYIELSCDFS